MAEHELGHEAVVAIEGLPCEARNERIELVVLVQEALRAKSVRGVRALITLPSEFQQGSRVRQQLDGAALLYHTALSLEISPSSKLTHTGHLPAMGYLTHQVADAVAVFRRAAIHAPAQVCYIVRVADASLSITLIAT